MVLVNVDNFRAAETARMFDQFVALGGGLGNWTHFRAPTPLESQTVIRMNRDTLYSLAIVDVRAGATLTIPEHDGRYVSVMAVNTEHYINQVFREPGAHELTEADLGTPFVALAARVFVDPADPDDVAAVNAIQDGFAVEGPDGAATAFEHPDYDTASLDATRDALLALGRGLPDARHTFGRKDAVDPVRHLIGTATGWGGLPETEAFYAIDSQPREVGRFTLTLRDVPADAFWSVSIYNRDGFFEANPFDSYNINSVTAEAEPDGSVVLDLAPEPGDGKNHLYVMDGWNYTTRLYQPRAAVLDGSWSPPQPQPA